MDFKTWGEEFWSHCDSDMDPEVKALALESGIAELNGYKFNEGDEIPQAVQFVQSWCFASGLKLTDAAMLLVAGLGDRVGFLVAWVWALKFKSGDNSEKLGVEWVLSTFGESYKCPSEEQMIRLCKLLKGDL